MQSYVVCAELSNLYDLGKAGWTAVVVCFCVLSGTSARILECCAGVPLLAGGAVKSLHIVHRHVAQIVPQLERLFYLAVQSRTRSIVCTRSCI